jgi:FO synthase
VVISRTEAGISRAEACRLIHAEVVTYSGKVFISLTNLCRDRCGYCTFAREADDLLVHTMTPEEVLQVARAGRRAGRKEALFSLGDEPELRYSEYRAWLEGRAFRSTIEYLRAMCELVCEETGLLPHANPVFYRARKSKCCAP